MRTKFKAWAEPYLKEHFNIGLMADDYPNISFKEKNNYLEVGSGKGGFLIGMAKNNPDYLFVGVEKNVTCAGITCKKIVDSEIPNALIVFADIEKIFPLIKDNFYDGVFLNFSDPWPKKRHEKRRLTDKRFLDNYYRILKKGAKLIFKTDNKELFDFSIKMFENSDFQIVSIDDDYDGKAKFDVITEYEADFRAEGMPIYRLVAKKK